MNHYNLVLNQNIREILDRLWKKEADNANPWWKHKYDSIDKLNEGKTYERK